MTAALGSVSAQLAKHGAQPNCPVSRSHLAALQVMAVANAPHFYLAGTGAQPLATATNYLLTAPTTTTAPPKPAFALPAKAGASARRSVLLSQLAAKLTTVVEFVLHSSAVMTGAPLPTNASKFPPFAPLTTTAGLVSVPAPTARLGVHKLITV